jgi:hypothetical protein
MGQSLQPTRLPTPTRIPAHYSENNGDEPPPYSKTDPSSSASAPKHPPPPPPLEDEKIPESESMNSMEEIILEGALRVHGYVHTLKLHLSLNRLTELQKLKPETVDQSNPPREFPCSTISKWMAT